jgi:hypothetical protein
MAASVSTGRALALMSSSKTNTSRRRSAAVVLSAGANPPGSASMVGRGRLVPLGVFFVGHGMARRVVLGWYRLRCCWFHVRGIVLAGDGSETRPRSTRRSRGSRASTGTEKCARIASELGVRHRSESGSVRGSPNCGKTMLSPKHVTVPGWSESAAKSSAPVAEHAERVQGAGGYAGTGEHAQVGGGGDPSRHGGLVREADDSIGVVLDELVERADFRLGEPGLVLN